MKSDCAFRWLRTGDEAYAAMLEAIGQATKSVRFETYTFSPNGIGRVFRDSLVEAARRRVRVQVLADAFGSSHLPAGYFAPLRDAGGEFRWFNPLSFRRLTFRDHRKLLVCDDDLAFVGGFNVAPEYEGNGVTRGWRDVGLLLTGPLALNLAAAFDAQYERADTEHQTFTRFRRSFARSVVACTDGELHLSGPGRGRNTIKRALLADLETARRVQIAAGYFLLAGRLRRSLLRVVRRGGTVQLVLAGQSDVALSQLASQAHYQRYLRAGIEIWEYQPQVLHSKLVIADQAAYVGSSNLDPRSLHINYELMVRLTNPVVVSEAREIFADHLANSQQVDPVTWAKSRSLWRRFKERWASFLLGRLDRALMRWQLGRLDSTLAEPS